MDTATPTPDTDLLPRQAVQIKPYSNENTLFWIMAVLSVLLLIGLTFGTFGVLWLFVLWGYVGVLCVGSYLISWVRGNGARITAEQFPDLHGRLLDCCTVTGVKKPPEFYLLAGDGMRNAFATRFLNRYYVVLLSDIVDGLEDDPEALNFYIGHELGHIARGHLAKHWLILPVVWLPLIGAAYSRAREYTCDQFGLACCNNIDSAVHALTALSVGGKRWKTLNKSAYTAQAADTGGFWMSLNEVLADYPWLSKRVARIRGEQEIIASRNPLAMLLACLVPNTGLGVIGAFVLYSYFAMVFVLVFGITMITKMPGLPGMLGTIFSAGSTVEESVTDTDADADAAASDAAAADTSESDLESQHATVLSAHVLAADVYSHIDAYVTKNQRLPSSLSQAGYEKELLDGVEAIDYPSGPKRAVSVRFAEPNTGYRLDYVRTASLKDEDGAWSCTATGMPAAVIPKGCDSADAEAEAD